MVLIHWKEELKCVMIKFGEKSAETILMAITIVTVVTSVNNLAINHQVSNNTDNNNNDYSYNCYISGSLLYSRSYFGNGEGPVVIINPLCYGSESSILDCYQISVVDDMTEINCGTNEIEGLVCQSL